MAEKECWITTRELAMTSKGDIGEIMAVRMQENGICDVDVQWFWDFGAPTTLHIPIDGTDEDYQNFYIVCNKYFGNVDVPTVKERIKRLESFRIRCLSITMGSMFEDAVNVEVCLRRMVRDVTGDESIMRTRISC